MKVALLVGPLVAIAALGLRFLLDVEAGDYGDALHFAPALRLGRARRPAALDDAPSWWA